MDFPGRLLVASLSLLTLTPTASALQPVRLPDGDSPWSTGTTCELTYYNVCTGWVWIWQEPPGPATRWSEFDRVGVVATACCENPRLTATWLFAAQGAYPGYGYLDLSIRGTDASGCPSGAPLASQFLVPVTGWNFSAWDLDVPPEFVLVGEVRTDYGHVEGCSMTTDHPAAQGGEPPACGSCYPGARETRSWYWGTAATPICPGLPLFDGTCNAELMITLMLDCTVSIQPQSWTSIKALYR